MPAPVKYSLYSRRHAKYHININCAYLVGCQFQLGNYQEQFRGWRSRRCPVFIWHVPIQVLMCAIQYIVHRNDQIQQSRETRQNPGHWSWSNKKVHKNALLKLPRERPPLCTPNDIFPASSIFPCCRKSTARLLTEVSVSGWCAPSLTSRARRHLRKRASAWHLEMALVLWGHGAQA